MRTSMGMGSSAPWRLISLSSSMRRRLACRRGLMCSRLSRYSVPPWAHSMRPLRPPGVCPALPKSSASSSSSLRAAQLTGTKGSDARGEALWMAWAKMLLPVPLSPWIRMEALLRAMRRAMSRARLMAALLPTMSSKRCSARWLLRLFWRRRELCCCSVSRKLCRVMKEPRVRSSRVSGTSVAPRSAPRMFRSRGPAKPASPPPKGSSGSTSETGRPMASLRSTPSILRAVLLMRSISPRSLTQTMPSSKALRMISRRFSAVRFFEEMVSRE